MRLLPEQTEKVVVSQELLRHMQMDGLLAPFLDDPVLYLTANTDEIAARNRIIGDLLINNALFNALEALYQNLCVIHACKNMTDGDVQRTLSSIAIVHDLYQAILRVQTEIEAAPLTTGAFSMLSAELSKLKQEVYPGDFSQAWALRAGVADKPGSITYRICFNEMLEMTGFALVSVRAERYKKPGRLLPHAGKEAAFRRVLTLQRDAPSGPGMHYDPARGRNPAQILHTAAMELQRLQTEPLRRLLSQFSMRVDQQTQGLRKDLAFCIGAVRLLREIDVESRFTFAQCHPKQAHVLEAVGAYHPALAVKLAARADRPVPCDINMAADGAIQMVSGANGGGKTTYLRTCGALQVMFQLGLPVPARHAKISPADSLVCAFSAQEERHTEAGRLGQELEAFATAARSLMPDGVFYFNEPITGASAQECAYICAEVLAALKANGQRGFWVTHLYPFVDMALRMNQALPGSTIGSLYAGAEGVATFVLKKGAPTHSSRAQAQYRSILHL